MQYDHLDDVPMQFRRSSPSSPAPSHYSIVTASTPSPVQRNLQQVLHSWKPGCLRLRAYGVTGFKGLIGRIWLIGFIGFMGFVGFFGFVGLRVAHARHSNPATLNP